MRVGPLAKSHWGEGDFVFFCFFETLIKEMIMCKEHNNQNKRPAGPYRDQYNSLVKKKKKHVKVWTQN